MNTIRNKNKNRKKNQKNNLKKSKKIKNMTCFLGNQPQVL